MNRHLLRALLAGALLWSGPALAAAPTTSLLDGVLTSSGGSAAADGDYDITFTIYDAASGGAKVWSEGPVKVKVSGGRFSHVLGSATTLDMAKLVAAKGQWLALKVGSDPELPAQSLHASVFSLHAGTAAAVSCDGCISGDQIANGSMAAAKVGFNYAGSNTKGGPAAELACTACVSVAEMKFDGDVDLGANSLKAKNGTFSGAVAAAEFVGDGSKLTGIKTASGECKNAGEVVKGINADGTLKCVAALDPTALPKDGLNEISNDLISNQFVDTIAGASNVAIPDNTGAEANAVMDFPDIGISQTFELTVEVSNTDLSTLALTILPPDDKKTGWTLCDPCGDKDAKTYKKTFSKDALPKSGDLAKWIGANPKGTWNLKALDSSFCIPQAPGNSGICDVNNKTDGKIVAWSIKIQTLSNKKISINGDSYQSGNTYAKNVDISGTLTVAGTKWFGHFPEGSRPFLFGELEDGTQGNWNAFGNQQKVNDISELAIDNQSLYRVADHILWGDKGGQLMRTEHKPAYNDSGNRSSAYMINFVKNTTDKDIAHTVCFYCSSRDSSRRCSFGVNKTTLYTYTGNGIPSRCQPVTFKANSTSVVVLKSGVYYWTGGYYFYPHRLVIGYYNNAWNLPAGLEWDYDRYNQWLANK